MKKTILILLALCLLIAVFSACGKKEPEAASEAATEAAQETPAGAQDETAPKVQDPDATSFNSVQALVDSAEAARKTGAENRTDAQNMLAGLDEVYAPEAEFEGYELLGAEALDGFLVYYYMPKAADGPTPEGFDYRTGITMAVCTIPEVTLMQVCEEMGITPDVDGYAYDAEHQQMYFTQDGHTCSLQVPEGTADPEEMKKLCKITKIPLD